jgi:hypothetical protein
VEDACGDAPSSPPTVAPLKRISCPSDAIVNLDAADVPKTTTPTNTRQIPAQGTIRDDHRTPLLSFPTTATNAAVSSARDGIGNIAVSLQPRHARAGLKG